MLGPHALAYRLAHSAAVRSCASRSASCTAEARPKGEDDAPDMRGAHPDAMHLYYSKPGVAWQPYARASGSCSASVARRHAHGHRFPQRPAHILLRNGCHQGVACRTGCARCALIRPTALRLAASIIPAALCAQTLLGAPTWHPGLTWVGVCEQRADGQQHLQAANKASETERPSSSRHMDACRERAAARGARGVRRHRCAAARCQQQTPSPIQQPAALAGCPLP